MSQSYPMCANVKLSSGLLTMNSPLSLFVAVLIIFSNVCKGQSKKESHEHRLSSFSSDQLKACFDDASICGNDDVYEISEELARRLPKLPTQLLVECFDDWKICGVGEGQASGWPISDELARRGDPHDLLERYWKEPKWAIRSGIEDVAYHFDSPEVTSFMRKVLADRLDDGEDWYWPINYLAKKCDQTALKELATGRYRNQGSMQYETSVKLFGKCQYRAAIPYLVDTAVYDFSLNIVAAADRSLHALYPDGPKDFDRLEAMQTYFCSRAKEEGFT
jgi:hypothetical protein